MIPAEKPAQIAERIALLCAGARFKLTIACAQLARAQALLVQMERAPSAGGRGGT